MRSRIDAVYRNALLAVAAGSSLAYVLVHILPKLAEKQESLMAGVDPGVLGFLEHHVYIMAMAGLVIYYAVQRVAGGCAEQGNYRSPVVYRLAQICTICGYGAYSLLIGYLMADLPRTDFSFHLLITVAMAAHFLVSDHGLWHHWPNAYDRGIKWVLSIALLAGWAIGVLTEVSSDVIALWFSFLAGGMLIMTIREELPSDYSWPFWPFLAGVVAYTGLVLVIEQMRSVL